MSEIMREFHGGVWTGTARAVDEETTAVLGSMVAMGTTSKSIGTVWSLYELRGDAMICTMTGSENECRQYIGAKLNEGAD